METHPAMNHNTQAGLESGAGLNDEGEEKELEEVAGRRHDPHQQPRTEAAARRDVAIGAADPGQRHEVQHLVQGRVAGGSVVRQPAVAVHHIN